MGRVFGEKIETEFLKLANWVFRLCKIKKTLFCLQLFFRFFKTLPATSFTDCTWKGTFEVLGPLTRPEEEMRSFGLPGDGGEHRWQLPDRLPLRQRHRQPRHLPDVSPDECWPRSGSTLCSGNGPCLLSENEDINQSLLYISYILNDRYINSYSYKIYT